MLSGHTVQDTRQLFFDSWQKHKQGQLLTALEHQLIEVILQHSDYHAVLDKKDSDAEYREGNPFLHMGLHLTIRDQITLNRPAGMQKIFQQLLKKHGDQHHVEHMLLEPLMACLWMAQKHQSAPDEQAYLKACSALVNGS